MSRNRLLNLIIKWIQSEGSKLDIPMFPEKLVERIQNFCDTTLVEDGMQTTAQKIKKLLVNFIKYWKCLPDLDTAGEVQTQKKRYQSREHQVVQSHQQTPTNDVLKLHTI